jgi:hypothetical protein
VAGGVVEDVGFGEVVHAFDGPYGDGGGEFAAAEAIEEEEAGDVAANGLGLEAGEGLKAAVDIAEAGDAVVGKVEGFDAMEEVGIGVALPSGLDAGEELPPHLMIFFRI